MATLKYFDTLSGTWKYASTAQQSYVDAQIAGLKQYTDQFRNRNRIINGDFSVNQRGAASVTTLYGFVHDRWMNFCGGGTITYSTQTPALGELPESARSYARMVVAGHAAAGDFAELVQYIESVRTLSGKTATVSFWAKAASGTPKVAVALTQQFGQGGSPSTGVEIYAGQVTLSTVWTRYSVTVAIPSIAGKTFGSDGKDALALRFWVSGGSSYNALTGSLGIQNGTFDFWGVQVEEGASVTPYEQKTFDTEWRNCQRYYRKYPVLSGFVDGAANGVYRILPVDWLPWEMRAVPTVTVASIVAAGTGTTLDTNPTCNVGNGEVYVSGTAATLGAWCRWNTVIFNAEL